MGISDTIVAIGTPPGISALSVVRLSGPASLSVVSRICPGLPKRPEPRRAQLVRALDPDTGELLDHVLVTVFEAPGSYTGELMAEVSCHGGWLSPALILEACLRGGARRADAGEFTRRAFLNGKMDLLQAEAVLDLIEGRSRALHGAAVHQLDRGLSRRIAELRGSLVDLEAMLVHHLDFPEEDDPPVPTAEILSRAMETMAMMEDLLRLAPEGELLREGAITVLAGLPNSGKSSVFNALLGEERAIVTEVPGTTRDALEVVVSLGGFPFRLVDTAGLRETDEKVERIGIEVARRYLLRADVILFCVEGLRALSAAEAGFLEEVVGAPVVLVRTKMDLFPGFEPEEPAGAAAIGNSEGQRVEEIVAVSAETGDGLDRLREVLPGLAFRGLVRSGVQTPLLTRQRQADGIRMALKELGAFAGALAGGLPMEVAATHLRPAETALEELLGVIPREEILDRVFREFCIGK